LRLKAIGYWMATVLVALPLLSGGTKRSRLGSWKVLGGIALLAPRFPRLKEWAYAGAFFDLRGAAASHLVCGGASWRVVMTIVLAALAMIS
jgi:DoxX-like family